MAFIATQILSIPKLEIEIERGFSLVGIGSFVTMSFTNGKLKT